MATKDQHAQLLALLQQVLELAQQITTPRTTGRPSNAAKSSTPGIHPNPSKYNPWRAFVWCPVMRKQVYLGCFPSKAKALAAQKDYRSKTVITEGTKAPVRVVHSA